MNNLLQFLSDMGQYILESRLIFYAIACIGVAFLFMISLFLCEKRPINRRRRKADKEFAPMNRDNQRFKVL